MSTASFTRSTESAVYWGTSEPSRYRELFEGAQREAVRHPGQVVRHPVGVRRAGDQRDRRVLHVEVEEPLHHPLDPAALGLRLVAEVYALEHEPAQPAHRAAHLVSLDDVPRRGRALD